MRPKSKKPKKQRKYEFNIPLNESHKLVSVHLSKELKEERGFRSLPVRPKDEVLIVRGEHKGKKAKVVRVEPQDRYVVIEKLTRNKTNKDPVPIFFHPSNLIITKIHKSRDRFRVGLINRRTKDEEAKIDFDSIVEEEDVIDFDEAELDEENAEEDEFVEDEETDDEEVVEDDDDEVVESEHSSENEEVEKE